MSSSAMTLATIVLLGVSALLAGTAPRWTRTLVFLVPFVALLVLSCLTSPWTSRSIRRWSAELFVPKGTERRGALLDGGTQLSEGN